jgi:hypothetical protein
MKITNGSKRTLRRGLFDARAFMPMDGHEEEELISLPIDFVCDVRWVGGGSRQHRELKCGFRQLVAVLFSRWGVVRVIQEFLVWEKKEKTKTVETGSKCRRRVCGPCVTVPWSKNTESKVDAGPNKARGYHNSPLLAHQACR